MSIQINKNGQAVPERVIPIIAEAAFEKKDGTDIYWLGNAGALINSRGTTVMIDPVLSGFDMPLLIDLPLTEAQVPHLDAILRDKAWTISRRGSTGKMYRSEMAKKATNGSKAAYPIFYPMSATLGILCGRRLIKQRPCRHAKSGIAENASSITRRQPTHLSSARRYSSLCRA